jgi:RNA polymerase sigma-70 factor (ECF subfamily)
MITTIVAGWRARAEALSLEAEGPDSVVRLIEGGLDRAYRMAGLILGDAAEAEDAVGDAIEAALRHARDLHDPARFGAWFDRILVNRCRDRLRRRSRIRFIPLAGDAIARHDPFADVLARDEAVRGLHDLSADERVVVVLHFWADLTLAEVALRTGWPLGTVKSRLHRALEGLRETAGKEVGDD